MVKCHRLTAFVTRCISYNWMVTRLLYSNGFCFIIASILQCKFWRENQFNSNFKTLQVISKLNTKPVLDIVVNFKLRFLHVCDCMHIEILFARAKLQVGQTQFYHILNCDLKRIELSLFFSFPVIDYNFLENYLALTFVLVFTGGTGSGKWESDVIIVATFPSSRVTMLESSTRVGGRVFTHYGEGWYGDLGAMRWLGCAPPPWHPPCYLASSLFSQTPPPLPYCQVPPHPRPPPWCGRLAGPAQDQVSRGAAAAHC